MYRVIVYLKDGCSFTFPFVEERRARLFDAACIWSEEYAASIVTSDVTTIVELSRTGDIPE